MRARALPLAVVLLLPAPAAAQARPVDLLIRGGRVVDGSGAPPRAADVAVSDGRIVAVGPGEGRDFDAARVIEAEGLVVAPGFIDVHAHADGDALERPEAGNFVLMGVTTVVTGNCGGSILDLGAHFAAVEKQGISLNYGSLIGHGTVRAKVMGRAKRDPSPEELERMKELVDRAMRDGAFGLSTGLIYVPGTYAGTDEIAALASVVARHGGLYASHMRNEADDVLEAVDEAITIGREAGVPVHLSHLKASGKRNWGRGTEIVAKLRKARRSGLPLTGDQYAYTASSTSIDVLFPSEELQVGRNRFAHRLATDEDFRARMERALFATMDRTGFGDLGYARIAFAPGNEDLNGRTLEEAAQLRLGKDDRESQARVTVDLYVASKGRRIGMVYHKMAEKDVEAIMALPFVAVAADAGIRSGRGKPHPRGSGNNPRVLGRYVRERGVLPLELAVHKMTGLPASTFGIEGRGEVREGFHADLVLFDPARIADRATYAEPLAPPEGIRCVIVNGEVVVEEGRHTGGRPGSVLRFEGRRQREPK